MFLVADIKSLPMGGGEADASDERMPEPPVAQDASAQKMETGRRCLAWITFLPYVSMRRASVSSSESFSAALTICSTRLLYLS